MWFVLIPQKGTNFVGANTFCQPGKSSTDIIDFDQPEAVYLVMCDPSMNEL